MEEANNNTDPCEIVHCPTENISKAEDWYYISSHLIGVITLLFGYYCSKLLKMKFPETSGVFKIYIYIYHLTSTISAFSISSLTTPVYYLPLIAGYSIGIFDYINISFPHQYHFTITLHYIFFSICVILFFYRYWLVRTPNPNFSSWSYYICVALIAFIFPAPYYITSIITYRSDPRILSLVKACDSYKPLLDIPTSYNMGRLFSEISLKIQLLLFSLNAFIFSAFLIILKFRIICLLEEQKDFMSKKTLSMHRKILQTLELQTLFPTLLLTAPSICVMVIILLDYPVSLNTSNMLITISQLHGIANSFGIIILNTSLLEKMIQDILSLLGVEEKVEFKSSYITTSGYIDNKVAGSSNISVHPQ